MIVRPHALSEIERLDALHDLMALETPGSAELGRLCLLAQDIFDVPMAIVTLIGRDEQILKARCGLDADRTTRDVAFCNYTILGDDVFVVADARADDRFSGNPFVTGAPYIRFYAGAPLILRPGVRLGSLCIIDSVPRTITERDKSVLRHLAEAAVAELKRDRDDLCRMAERFQERSATEGARLQLAAEQGVRTKIETTARIGRWEWDLATDAALWSEGIFTILGHEACAFEPSIEAFVRHLRPQEPSPKTWLRALRRASDDAFDLELRIVRTDGATRFVSVQGEILRNEAGAPTRLKGMMADITERREAEAAHARLRHLAGHDALTGLANRTLFQERLRQAVRRSDETGRRLALLMIDLGDVQDVNDTLGHEAGDSLLRLAAERLRSAVPPEATVARLGGDEFAVVMDLCPGETIDEVGQRCLSALRAPPPQDWRLTVCRASIGGAVYPDHGTQPTELMRDAHVALSAAKRDGRNSVAAYRPALGEATGRRIALTAEIRTGLGAGQFVPFYQPIVCLKTLEVVGFEALARWRHPDRGLLVPADFDLVFEDAELSIALGESMFEAILGDLSAWRADTVACGRIALNLSAADFADPGLAARMLEGLRAAGIPAHRFKIEVTETVFLDRSSDRVHESLQRLHDAGVTIALDDFGTGYASLIHLKRFPVDEIKIDRSFIGTLESNGEDDAIVSALLSMSDRLALGAIAEGIETIGQCRLLQDKGCDFGQGYLFARPMPAADVDVFLAGWTERRAEFRGADRPSPAEERGRAVEILAPLLQAAGTGAGAGADGAKARFHASRLATL